MPDSFYPSANIKIDDYPRISRLNPEAVIIADTIAEITKITATVFKFSALVGPIIGFPALGLYLQSEGATGVLLDCVSSLNFIVAVSVISILLTVITVFYIGAPVYSKMMIFSIKGYKPDYKLRIYFLHYAGLIIATISSPIAFGMEAIIPWQILAAASISISLGFTLWHAKKKLALPLDASNIVQISTSHFLANALSIGWIVGWFVLILRFLEPLGQWIIDKAASNVTPAWLFGALTTQETVIAYTVFYAGILLLLCAHSILSFIPIAWRAIAGAGAFVSLILLLWIPGAARFVEYGLSILDAGGNIPVTLVSEENKDNTFYGCLILISPSYYAFKKTDVNTVCESSVGYGVFIGNSKKPSLDAIRIVPKDKYQRHHRIKESEDKSPT